LIPGIRGATVKRNGNEISPYVWKSWSLHRGTTLKQNGNEDFTARLKIDSRHYDKGAVPMDSFTKKLLRGFTLIEMIVVICVIGILSSGVTLAISYIVQAAQEETFEQNEKQALAYVQNWLIDLEVKDFDMDILTPTDTSSGGTHYITIASVRCNTAGLTGPDDVGPEDKDFSGIKVALLAETELNPLTGEFTFDWNAADGFNAILSSGITADKSLEMAYDELKALSETLAPSFDGAWYVTVDTKTYTAEQAYWFRPDEVTRVYDTDD
jgi:prepilin-type N-terminal cleavage/methylation domain-containing protein